MKYTKQEVMQFVNEEDVKFIRLAFCDVFGRQKNISVMPGELERAFSFGISVDASAVKGFGGEVRSDLLLHPDPDTLAVLPWRPEHGKVVRMFCTISYPDGTPFESDTRSILIQAAKEAQKAGYTFYFGTEMEFYLFQLDDNGKPSGIPYDAAGYMDMAPDDKGENIRREICLTLEQMGIYPESSHHEEGPGQNEIDFRYSEAVTAADNSMTFSTAVKALAARNGLYADFSPKPMEKFPGNGLHINISVKSADGSDVMPAVIAGILENAAAMTVFFNPCEASYRRLGEMKAPAYISWSGENRSQLVRVPAAEGEYRRAELRSPDPMANSYLAFALLIYAGLHGIKNKLKPPAPVDINLYASSPEDLKKLVPLPKSLKEASAAALSSGFISEVLPQELIKAYGIE